MPSGPSVIHQLHQSKSPLVKRRPVLKQRLFKRQEQQLESPSAMEVFLMEEKSGQICHYASLNEFRQARFTQPKSGPQRGCFYQNGHLGQITMKPFAVVIKGLDTEYEYRHEYSLG